MNVKETYDFLEALLKDLNNRDVEKHELLIWTDERGLAGQKGVGVKCFHIGFDWYDRKIIITPDKPLVPLESHRDVPKKPFDAHIPIQYKPMVKPYYVCPNCEEPMKKSYHYCPKCGQKLDWEKQA